MECERSAQSGRANEDTNSRSAADEEVDDELDQLVTRMQEPDHLRGVDRFLEMGSAEIGEAAREDPS